MSYAKLRSLTEGRIAQLRIQQMVVGTQDDHVSHRIEVLEEYLRRLDEIALRPDSR
ncbi:MAG: hypothetical protein AAF493_05010 [Pseudomonadota bacterium]